MVVVVKVPLQGFRNIPSTLGKGGWSAKPGVPTGRDEDSGYHQVLQSECAI